MNMDIFIVSYERDFRYLKYCLRSIQKFAHDFHRVHLMVPNRDVVALYRETEFDKIKRGDWFLHTFNEWEARGMLHHLYLEMMADKYAYGADLILHTDSDCIFTGPVTPDHYLVDEKPILRYASYDWLAAQQPNLREWQRAVENALGWKPVNEFMRCHPAVHYPRVYEKAREAIECHTGRTMADYIRNGRNEFPQSFAEYPTLGEIAWTYFRPLYHWINEERTPRSDTRIRQAWSHQEPTNEDRNLFASLGLL
jgi:hypothetical protein